MIRHLIDATRRRMTGRALVALLVVQLLVLSSAMALAADRLVSAPLTTDGPYALLVMGSDMGPPRDGSALHGRSDALHLVVVSADRQYVSILDFPRDSWVDVTGIGRTKINAALTHGPDNAVATMEALTGIHIDDWVVTGFEAFVSAIDEFGGVTVNVEQRLHDPRGSSSNLYPGTQKLTGWSTLTYVRDRHSRPNGDFGRSAAQSKVLIALHDQIQASHPSPIRVAKLMSLLLRHTRTSLSASRLIRLTGLALSIPSDHIGHEVVSGVNGMAGKASIVRLTGHAYEQFKDLRSDGVLESVRQQAAG